MSELDWMHDDITWCARECPNHGCFRNRVNRREKKGMFSTGDMYEEGKCPPEASIEEFNERMREYKEKQKKKEAESDKKCDTCKYKGATEWCQGAACPEYKKKEPSLFETLLNDDTLRECIGDMKSVTDMGDLLKNYLNKIAEKEAEKLMRAAFTKYDPEAQVQGEITYKDLKDLEMTAILYGMMYALYDLQGERRPE